MDLCVLGLFWDQGSSCDDREIWPSGLRISRAGTPPLGHLKIVRCWFQKPQYSNFCNGPRCHVSAFARANRVAAPRVARVGELVKQQLSLRCKLLKER